MKKLMSLLVVLSLASVASATPYQFNGVSVEVDAWVGSGANETILVVDWNRLDHGAETLSESHAFGYRWDGQKTEWEMLEDFDAADVFTIEIAVFDWGTTLGNIVYNDGTETHTHVESASWNTASTTNPYAYWGKWGNWGADSEWDWDWISMKVKNLASGRFEGLNAFAYYLTPEELVDGVDTSFQLDIPLVPEPATLVLLMLGAVGLGKRRSRLA
jgi:hypothetical protein